MDDIKLPYIEKHTFAITIFINRFPSETQTSLNMT